MDLAATVQRTDDIFHLIPNVYVLECQNSRVHWKGNVCLPLCRMCFRCRVLDVAIWMGCKIGNLELELKQLSCPWHFNNNNFKKKY